MADPDLGLRMGGGGGQFCFDTLHSFCPSLIPSFFTKIRGGGRGAPLDPPLYTGAMMGGGACLICPTKY